MKAPGIKTAIPQRRYQLGAFSIVVLGDIESDDGVDYRYVCAVVQEGGQEPSLYVLSLRMPDGPANYMLKILSPTLERELDVSGRWRDLDAFCEQGIALVQQVLDLTDEQAYRLG